ncbi:MAG: type II toxin-antitoxin system VapC family toxin, partial [Candidatus Dormibacteraeota bacterium]|nr:type II toxin-antitoxin system VapC family toxin [Candidatus Dormibacteraeota bacterium]MBO0760212.1 type II toxin-antitoxin system VapC family toxin [Candidatus Dormibacteraeota bacterium]
VAREAISDPEAEVRVSAVSAWEISIKRALGKLEAPGDLEAMLEGHGFLPLSIHVRHALLAGELPRHHDDPFDRMLVAQAQLEELTIVSRDERLRSYGVSIIQA